MTARTEKTYPDYLVGASTKGLVPSMSNAILDHEEQNIDEESTDTHDPLITNPSSNNRSSVDIDGPKDRRKSNENTNNKYNNASLVRLADLVDSNRAMRHDKGSNLTSSTEIINNSKLKTTRSL